MFNPPQFSAFLKGTLLVIGLAGLQLAAAQTIVQNDWEDGTLQGWIPRGGVTLANSTVTAHSGTHSLLTTGRTAGFNGPSLNVFSTLAKGATYQVTVWGRLTAGTAATQLKITVQRTVSGSNNFDTVAQSGATAVTDSAWTQLTGLYAFSGDDPSALLLYVESASATASFYIDDFSIVKIADPAGPPPNTTGLVSTFETATTEGWGSRIGTETVAVSTADAHSGAYSLLTTGRTAAFQGPAYNVTNVMFNGSRYQVSLWVKLAPGQGSAQVRASLQRNAGTVTTFHTVIGNTTVTDSAWTRLITTYDVALANSSLQFYIETASGTPSFYIDDVSITYVAPPTIEAGIPSLSDVFRPYFDIGTIAFAGDITGVESQLLAKHFDSITSENDTK
jgi:endo-1,4-beta-xylanase